MKRTILITGISTGIGKAFVELAANSYPNDTIIALTRRKITYDVPNNVAVYYVDITEFSKTNKLFKKITKKHGDVDILINNAGNGSTGTVEDTTIHEAKAQFDLNVWAAVNLTQQVLPAMRKRKSGHIINVSSIAATIDYPAMAYYGASKTLLEKLSRILALEVGDWNITISTVTPGATKTKFGSNMSSAKRIKNSPYATLYESWTNKFTNLFKEAASSEQVAEAIVSIINNPRSYKFVTKRDMLYVKLKKTMTDRFFNTHLLNKHMRTK